MADEPKTYVKYELITTMDLTTLEALVGEFEHLVGKLHKITFSVTRELTTEELQDEDPSKQHDSDEESAMKKGWA